jgi:hypothetical protein
MKESSERIIYQREKDNALLNFVSRQAQEAILNPTLPESYKDEILEAALGTIQKVAERKAVYYAKYEEGHKSRRRHKIYEAGNDEDQEQENTPSILEEINEFIYEIPAGEKENYTVEWIAQDIGINKKILYEWVKTDSEFSETLERLKDVQKNDPFRTGSFMDTGVNAMMIAMVLMQTRDRHYKPQNL